MRVISGIYKGRVLFSPKGNLIRPTSDRIKESIFNYFGKDIRGSVVCDLFSGTGNLSIEALSRGAERAVLVDNSRQAIELIYRNIDLIGLLEKSRIIKKDVLQYLKIAAKNKDEFDFIFADPPYFSRLYEKMIGLIEEGNLLKKGGLFILEQSSQENISMVNQNLIKEAEKNFGDTSVIFYSQKGT